MNIKLSSLCAAAALALFGSGCASLQSVSVTNIPSERGRPIEASDDNVAFLGLHFDNDFADGVPDELIRQCPNGKVTGIYSKYETTWYVLIENRSVTAKGYCVPSEKQATRPAAPVPAAPLPPVAPPSAAPPPSPSSAATSDASSPARGAR